jgi:hypothetical protein
MMFRPILFVRPLILLALVSGILVNLRYYSGMISVSVGNRSFPCCSSTINRDNSQRFCSRKHRAAAASNSFDKRSLWWFYKWR